MSEPVKGSCLCGTVEYEITGNIGIFQYCHCSRCRKVTGSAHASNLFVSPEHFQWTKGEDMVGTYQPEDTKYFSTSFCKNCGSNLPWTVKTGNVVVVPAGTLNDDPGITPSQSIFYASGACWYKSPKDLPQHETTPQK